MNLDLQLKSPSPAQPPVGAPTTSVAELSGFRGLVGSSPAMLKLYEDLLEAVAEPMVLLEGETGTGKNLVAQVLHDLGADTSRPVVKIAGADLELELFRSELARLSPAHTAGTVILEEVETLPGGHQETLLRFVRSTLPSLRQSPGSGRVVATTQCNLLDGGQAGTFLAPLARILARCRLEIPALRHRHGDLPVLVRHFLDGFCQQYGRSPVHLEELAWEVLHQHPWAGNVRELRNEIERLVVLAPESGCIDLFQLSPEVRQAAGFGESAKPSLA